jgi:serine/threonine/tyrosine-interacting protein
MEVRSTPVLPKPVANGDVTVKRRYDMRHQCQEILPGLLLGPFQVSKNLATLKELGISHMYASCRRNFRTDP